MTFRELKRLQLDIETYCQSGFNFPSAAPGESDRITAIALSDSTGWEQLISSKEYSEAARCCVSWHKRISGATRT